MVYENTVDQDLSKRAFTDIIIVDQATDDTAYGSAALFGWMIGQKEIASHVPVWDKTIRKDNTFFSSAFHRDEQANEYRVERGSRWSNPACRILA